ncbi:MAG: hypothetical protein N2317_06140 [Syntrophales bacterium]|nr:hypothetical protein [Syntrophales bacterium]
MTLITLQIIQLLIDVFLLAVLMLLFRTIRSKEKEQLVVSQADFVELKRLMDESQTFASEFMAKLDEGKRELQTIATSLDEREKRLHEIVEKAEKMYSLPSNREDEEVERERYGKALKLLEMGHELKDIARELNLTAGELDLLNNIIRFRSSQKE